MLPGKKYTPDDYLRIAWKRRWFIVVPLVIIASTTAVVAFFLPNRYQASTSILVIPQRVPEDFVQSTVTAELGERLNIISQQILSRTRLERIIQEFNLYERERTRMIMEDVVQRMRQDISLNLDIPRSRRDTSATSFKIGFESEDARMAMRVTERLASLFVQENLEDRSLLADQTNQFIQGQLEEAKRRLLEHEKKLQDFRQRNNGQLPDQVQTNLSMMQTTQTQLQNVIEQANRDRDRLQVVERMLGEATQLPPVEIVQPPPTQGQGDQVFTGTAAQQLTMAKSQLAVLQLRLKPEHPDIGRAKRLIGELEAKAEAEALQQPLSATSPAPIVIRDKALLTRIENLRAESVELRQRLESAKREVARFQGMLGAYTARVQAAPALEAQLTELTRDYLTLQGSYTSLLKNSEESKMAVNLERRQIGEQFKVIDGARLPERPVSPDRFRINMLGILGGLAFGLGFVGLLEYRDSSLKSDDDIVTTLALPVLAVIPLMTNAVERRALRRRRILLAVSASVACIAVAAAVMVVWRLQLVEAWLR